MVARKILYGYQTIAQYYTTLVLNGTLKQGERMPTVREAAADWGVAPQTVLRSYWEMRDAGLVEILKGTGGTRVATRGNSPAPVGDLVHLAG
jgi:DNA-binding transcriptional regulator YhcF (GntR family)